jgi:hypothetical protein
VEPVSAPTRARRRQVLASELLIMLAVTVERWGREVVSAEPGLIPFGEWPDDDPLRDLVLRHGLPEGEVRAVCQQLGARLERQAERSGYDSIPTEPVG